MGSPDPVQNERDRAMNELRRRTVVAERLASITQLTGGITHEIGTPLTAILGYAELIAKSVADDKNRKRATTIVEQVHRIGDLIETLMNLSRAEGGNPLPLELADTLDRALDFYREKFKRRGVEIERHYDVHPRVLGVPDGLHHVFLSLFLNRLDAMPRGGVLRVSLLEGESGEVEVRIFDRGTPIDPGLEARIFGNESGSQRLLENAALGLHVAKSIVEEHAGRLSLLSDPERGTEFFLHFPPHREEAR